GKNWTNITPKQMPEWTRVNLIEPSPFDVGTAYVAADLHFSNDFRPMIFKTTNFGKTWTEITNGIPKTAYVHAVRSDPKRKALLYAGTETGIYVSFDGGANWQTLQLNLPRAPIYDHVVHADDLVVATHGRAFWVLDNITPLRQATAEMASQAVHLYSPTTAYRERGPGGFFGGGGARRNAGQNPPAGAAIDYYLASTPSGQLTLEVLDGQGRVVHRASSEPQGAGGAAGPRRQAAGRPGAPGGRGRR